MTKGTKTLPAGYVELSGIAVHMATLRRFTADPQRFLRLAPMAERLTPLEPGSVEATAIYQEAMKAGDTDALIKTMAEYAQLQATMATELESGETGEGPPAYFKLGT